VIRSFPCCYFCIIPTLVHSLTYGFFAVYVLCLPQVSAIVKESCEGVTQAAVTRAQALTRAQHVTTAAAAADAGADAASSSQGSTVPAAATDDTAAAAAALDSAATAGSHESQKAEASSNSTQQQQPQADQQQQQQQQQCGFVWAQIRVSPEQTLRDHYNAAAAAAAKEDACKG
jgi:hypothetical protein